MVRFLLGGELVFHGIWSPFFAKVFSTVRGWSVIRKRFRTSRTSLVGNPHIRTAVPATDETGASPENNVLNPLDRVQFAIHAKGKVERGVFYVRGNALKGRRFNSLPGEHFS
jgi:hypothetical protein